MSVQWLTTMIIAAIVLFGGGLLITVVLGVVVINERQVGVVVKKFSSRGLPPGQLIALHGESGYQADTLAPGWHFGYWPWQYSVVKAPITVVPQGEIALVVAADGSPNPPQRILGKVTECDNAELRTSKNKKRGRLESAPLYSGLSLACHFERPWGAKNPSKFG